MIARVLFPAVLLTANVVFGANPRSRSKASSMEVDEAAKEQPHESSSSAMGMAVDEAAKEQPHESASSAMDIHEVTKEQPAGVSLSGIGEASALPVVDVKDPEVNVKDPEVNVAPVQPQKDQLPTDLTMPQAVAAEGNDSALLMPGSIWKKSETDSLDDSEGQPQYKDPEAQQKELMPFVQLVTHEAPVANSTASEMVLDSKAQDVTEEAEVPKIIHFMFKRDLSVPNAEWPNPIWKKSFESWRQHFPEPEYKYQFWTDSTIDRFFKDSCSEHYLVFKTYTNEIYKADLGRYCILKNMGGIYADLDYEPRVNFFNDLKPGKVSLIESPYHNEKFQNSLMAAPAGDKFTPYWKGLLELAEVKRQFADDPVEDTGPKLLDAYPLNSDASVVNTLPCSQYQLKIHNDGQPAKKQCGYLTADSARNVKGIHWGTTSYRAGKWGQLEGDLEGQSANADTIKRFRFVHPEVEEAVIDKILKARADGSEQESTLVEMSVAGDGHMEREKVPAEKRRHLTKQERDQVAGFSSVQSSKEQKRSMQKRRKAAATTTEAPDEDEILGQEEMLETSQPQPSKLSEKGKILAQGFDIRVPASKEERDHQESVPSVRVSNVVQQTIRVHHHSAKPSQAEEGQLPTVRAVAEPEAVVSNKRSDRRKMFGKNEGDAIGSRLFGSMQMADDDTAEPTDIAPAEPAGPAPKAEDPASQRSQDPASQEGEAGATVQPTAQATTESPQVEESSGKERSSLMLIITGTVIVFAVCVVVFVILGSRAQAVEWGQATVATITGRRGEGADRELSEKRHLLAGPQKVMLNTQRSTPSDAGNRSSGGYTSGHDDKAGFQSSGSHQDEGRMKSAAAHLDRAARQQVSGADSSAGSAVETSQPKPQGRVSRPPRS